MQLLLEPTGILDGSKVLTISEDKLEELGLLNYHVCGVTWTSEGHPISYGIFNEVETRTILTRIDTVLNASIVNSDQRKAVKNLIEDIIRDRQYDITSWTSRRISQVTNETEGSSGHGGIIIDYKSY